MSLCRCGKATRHDVTDACLSPEDREYVRRFAAAYALADLGPWWHQAAGRDGSQAEKQTAERLTTTSAHCVEPPGAG